MFFYIVIYIVIAIAYVILQSAWDRRAAKRKEQRIALERQAKAEADAQAKAARNAPKAAIAANAAQRQAAAKASAHTKAVCRGNSDAWKAANQDKSETDKRQHQESERRETIFPFTGNNAFRGEIVAFTGSIDGMSRAKAIEAVEANGGKAYGKGMPAGTTILVVGNNNGRNTQKLEKADRWIGHVRKITPQQFKAMLALPITLTPDEFAQTFARVE